MSELEKEVKRFAETHNGEQVSSYRAVYNVGRHGISTKESTDAYHNWSATYEQDAGPDKFRGPVIAAESVAAFYRTHRDKVLILDVACGTGFVGQELQKRGFKQMDGLDPCSSLLEKARAKNIYRKEFCCYLNDKPLPIEDNTYDCAVLSGGMMEGHVPCSGLYQLARVVKPGGLVCIVMREEFLEHVQEYRDNLEPVITDLESRAIWRLASRTVVPNYFLDKNGVVFNFVKC
ncbi:methyltransferase-like protein 27 [Littorina saxatilis]|uniref:Methyltransferase domain-containing protein n=4 Tax=Littorina saxatilis TaxID=31220 RepID=A0AAN9ANB2_9CAEN